MRTRIHISLIAAALLGGGAARASGQNAALDGRWIVYLGCWQQVESAKSHVCVVPAGKAAVELLSIVKGEVASRERIDAGGNRVETARGDCTGWQSAEWSAIAARLYLRSGDKCATGDTHSGTGVIAMNRNGEWLYLQGMTRDGQTGVRVQRYREAGDFAVPDEVTNALRSGLTATMQARAAAAMPLAIEDVIDASRHVDPAVLEAWLVERGEPFALDAKRLVTLADAGVPSRVIDVMVALSYPKVFAINPMSRLGERVAPTATGGANAGETYGMIPANSLCSSFYPLSFYRSLYDCGYIGDYGYPSGYGYGFYGGGYPVTVVYVGSGGGHGHVVNGHGYEQGGGGGSGAMPRRDETGWATSSGGSTPATSSSTPSSSSSSGGEQRTAQPRKP
jgi:hypothetical protein